MPSFVSVFKFEIEQRAAGSRRSLPPACIEDVVPVVVARPERRRPDFLDEDHFRGLRIVPGWTPSAGHEAD
jgi:hypothetical protein